MEVSNFSIVAAVAAVSATLMITVATLGLGDLCLREDQQNSDSLLQVAKTSRTLVQTNATGLAEISAYTIAGDSITYGVNAMNIEDVIEPRSVKHGGKLIT